MFNGTKALISEFSNILGSGNVYYEPPESIKLKYPCIIFKRETSNGEHADNLRYTITTKYSITLVDTESDSSYISAILSLPFTEHTNHYVSDGLHHDIFTIYW